MNFRIVQRLTSVPEGRGVNPFARNLGLAKVLLDAGSGVDLDYMGCAEFEGDVAIKSAERIARAAKNLKIVNRTLVRPMYEEDVRFICTDEQVGSTLPAWYKWARNPQSIEPTGYFKDDDRHDIGRAGDDVVGWWAMEEDLIWTRRPEVAAKILGAFVTLASQEA